MTATPEIKTKFTLDGIKEAARGFSRIGQSARESLGRVKKNAAEALEPMQKDVEKLRRSMQALKVAGAGALSFGGRAGWQGVRLGALGATAAVAGLAAQWGAVGAAAIKASRDTAAALDKIAKDSRRLGVSTEDMSVLGFAAEREGVNGEQAVKAIARIGSEWAKVRQQINGANAEFKAFRDDAAEDVALVASYLDMREQGVSLNASVEQKLAAALRAEKQGRLHLADYDKERLAYAEQSVREASMKSFEGIDQRIASRRADLAQYDVFRAGSDPHADRVSNENALNIRREIEYLEKARVDLAKSFGPVGEAVYGLQRAVGVDMESVAKGGVRGLMAIGDAIRQVQDPTERLRYSVLLFGEDAGPGLFNLLMKGREGMAEYAAEARRLGIVVSEAEAKKAEAYQDSQTNFQRSLQGVKMAIGSILLPQLTEANDGMTSFVTKHRERIAKLVSSGFENLRDFALDVWDIVNGNSPETYRTGWLNTWAERIKYIRDTWTIFREDVQKLMQGGDARWAWLDAIGKSIRTAVEFGKELWTVLNGGQSQRFPWLSELRDKLIGIYTEAKEWVEWFAQRFREAWDLFSGMLAWIRDTFLKPVADFFGMDPTTLALFIGLTKITGLFDIALKSVGLLIGGLKRLAFSQGFLASVASVSEALGAAGAAAGIRGAAGGAAAGAAGGAARGGLLRGALGLVGTVGGGLAAGAAIGAVGGYYIGDAINNRESNVRRREEMQRRIDALTTVSDIAEENEAARIRRRQTYLASRGSAKGLQNYWADGGVQISDQTAIWEAEKWMGRDPTKALREHSAIKQYGYGAFDLQGNRLTPDRPAVTDRIEIDLNFNGVRVKGDYAPDQARALKRAAEDMSRRGGY